MPNIENMTLQGPLARQGLQAFRNTEIRPHRIANTWFIIADSEHALICRRDGQGVELIGKALPHIPYNKEQGNESIGRRMRRKGAPGDAQGTNRQGMSPSYQSERHEELLFLQSLAVWLEEGLNKDAYEELVLVAAPRTLGELRQVLSERVRECVRQEIDKELVNLPEQDLKKKLSELL